MFDPTPQTDGTDSMRDPRLLVRGLTPADYPAVRALQLRCFPEVIPFEQQEFETQLTRFADGQIGVELDGRLVATSSSLVVDASDYSEAHTYGSVAGGSDLDAHDPEGDTLYGIDIAVDPDARGMRLSRRLYDARKALCVRLGLKGMLIGARLAGYHRHADRLTPSAYVGEVMRRAIEDRGLLAQVANGFTVELLLPGYLPNDVESGGNAVLMRWANPEYIPADRPRRVRRARVAAVQYQMRAVADFEQFCTQCEFYMETAAEYRCDFLLFPELLTNQLLGLVEGGPPGQAARALDAYTERYLDFFGRMAIKYAVNIIGGSHLTVEDGRLYNIAYLFHRNGRVDKQYKLHITPAEHKWWGVQGGDRIEVFETDRGRIAIAICYDVEFPEYVRVARARGARLLFVPFNTDIRSGYLRVRTCAAARCIENHIYAVIAGPVGNLPHVDGADIHYAQAAVLTPSDVQFARDGIAEQAEPGGEMMVLADLDLDRLRRTERTSTVRPWLDRRQDLYRVQWIGEGDGAGDEDPPTGQTRR